MYSHPVFLAEMSSKGAGLPHHRSMGILKPSCESCTGIPSLYTSKTRNINLFCQHPYKNSE